MRILFYRQAPAIYPLKAAFPHMVGVPPANTTTLKGHVSTYELFGNKGNMIHRMAMVQLLDFDRHASAHVNLPRAFGDIGPAAFASTVRQSFDCVVVTMSNIIRKGPSEESLLPALQHIDIPFYVVGVGLQDVMPESTSSLTKGMATLMSLIDSKAGLFGVRGASTKAWLDAAGFKRAVPIGCPSMFVYPRQILSLAPPTRLNRIMVAGHLHPKLLAEKGRNRARGLLQAFAGRNCSFVFQSELTAFTDFPDFDGAYSENLSTLDAAAMSAYIKKKSGLKSPFRTYYSFNDPSAWRSAALRHDVCISDRIHGAVAAMQAGVPALVLHADERVRELTAWHGIPNCAIDEFFERGVENSVSHYLTQDAFDRMKLRYRETYRTFAESVQSAGLKMNIPALPVPPGAGSLPFAPVAV